MPDLSITVPAVDAHVQPLQPFLVSGRASDAGFPEPHQIDTVTVQVDAGPVVEARVTQIPDKAVSLFEYSAEVTVTGGSDPHTLTVIAVNDNGLTATKQRQVFTGPIFHAAPPAVLVELLSPVPFHTDGPGMTRLVSQIQYALAPAADQLAAFGKLIAGPNLITGTDPSGLNLLRVGIWVQDAGFPVLPPQPPTFPLPRLNDPGAQAGFALADRLPVPLTLGLTFAMSVPTTTLQSLIDAVFPQVKDAVDGTFATLDAIRAGTRPPDTVTTSIDAHTLLDIPVSAQLTEKLGAPLNPGLGQHLPAVVGHDSSADGGDVLDWVVGVLLPPFGAALLAITAVASAVASDASDQANGLAASVVAGIPARIPLHNTDLGVDEPPFPTLVPDWTMFGTTPDGMLATGTAEIQGRDQSTVAMSINGAGYIEGIQSDLAGGAANRYSINMTDLLPDAGHFTWDVTGAGTSAGQVTPGPFAVSGTADVDFPLPLHVDPGEYEFVLTVTAAETCGTDPAKTLTGTASLPVRVKVDKDPIIIK
jgi:hypothetical protein